MTDADFSAAADRLYDAVDTLDGVGRTRTTKLLARKRPRFVPIVDKIVKTALDLPHDWHFQWWRDALADGNRRERIEALRPEGVDVSSLRLIDVAIWMACSNSRERQSPAGVCRG